MHQPSTPMVLIRGIGVVDQSNAMMFVVVGDEGQVIVRVHDVAAQEIDVEAFHVVEARGFEDDMCEFGGGLDLSLSVGAVG